MRQILFIMTLVLTKTNPQDQLMDVNYIKLIQGR
jgi:hypothetical protein